MQYCHSNTTASPVDTVGWNRTLNHGAHKGCCANAVVVSSLCREVVLRSLGCHCVFNTPSVSANAVKVQCMHYGRRESILRAQRIANTNSVGTLIECHASFVATHTHWSLLERHDRRFFTKYIRVFLQSHGAPGK